MGGCVADVLGVDGWNRTNVDGFADRGQSPWLHRHHGTRDENRTRLVLLDREMAIPNASGRIIPILYLWLPFPCA